MKYRKIICNSRYCISKVDISKYICENLVGEQYTDGHRMAVGVVIASMGVAIVQIAGMTEWAVIHFIADVFGYGLHGLGATPFIDKALKNKQLKQEENDKISGNNNGEGNS